MAKVTLTACDVCNSTDGPIVTYTLERPGTLVKVDLCEEHAEPLEECFETFAAYAVEEQPDTAGPGRGMSRGYSKFVTTMEDLQKMIQE